jgi:hypothetical protein
LLDGAAAALDQYRAEKQLGEVSMPTQLALLKAEELKMLHNNHGDKRTPIEKLSGLYQEAEREGVDVGAKIAMLKKAEPLDEPLANQPPRMAPLNMSGAAAEPELVDPVNLHAREFVGDIS